MKILWLAIAAVLLAGCAGDYGPGVDLSAANGQATVAAAQAQLKGTQRAALERAGHATMQAAATQGAVQAELDLLRGRIEATHQAQELAFQRAEATQAAQQELAIGTQAAAAGQATADALGMRRTQEAIGARATATAVALDLSRRVQDAQRQEERDAFWGQWLPVIELGVLIVVLVVLLRWGWQITQWWMEWRDRRMRLYETRQGTVVFQPGEDGYWYPQLLLGAGKGDGRRRTGDRGRVSELTEGQVVRLTPSGSVLESLPGRSGEAEPGVSGLAVAFLREAVVIVGEESEVLPGWRKVPGWSSERWQRVIAALAAAGAVEVKAGVETRVSEAIGDVGNLRYLVETRQIKVRPVSIK